MSPSLGERYEIEIETVSKPREEYKSDEYLKTGLPAAPAIMIADEIIVKGSDISEDKLEATICKHLGIDPPERKGFLGKLFNK